MAGRLLSRLYLLFRVALMNLFASMPDQIPSRLNGRPNALRHRLAQSGQNSGCLKEKAASLSRAHVRVRVVSSDLV